MSNTAADASEGMAADTAADVTVDSALTEAFAEINSGEGSGAERPAAEGTAPAAEPPVADPAATPDPAAATPDHWSAEEQARFDALPADVKALAEKRIASIEADYRTKGAANAELADGIRGIVDRNGFRDVLAQSGMNEVQGVEYLTELERFAREKPADYLRFVADHVRERFGVDPAQVLGLAAGTQPPAQGEDGFTDPRIADIDKRLGELGNHIQQDAQRRAMETAGREIAAFRDAKDGAGNALRPHFAEVEADMAQLVRANPQMTLEKAYETAVWSNPTVRAKLQEADRAEVQKKARDEAAAAQKAAKGNVRSGSRNMNPAQQVDSVDDAVSQAMAEVIR